MDKQKEREAFEDKLKRMGKVDDSTFVKNEDGSYQMDIIHFGWKMWQAAKAQAIPDSFVVVPIAPILKILDAASSLAPIKTMIEAQESTND